MVVVTPVTAGCRSLSRVARLGRSDEGNELPLFKDLAAASSSRMLYPFSKPNEIELSLADVVSAKFKRVSTFNTSILPSVKSDLLKHETEKTESNWLLTPPDSPLFPTLDYEALGASLLPSPKQKSRLSKMSTTCFCVAASPMKTAMADGREKWRSRNPMGTMRKWSDKRLQNQCTAMKHVEAMARLC